MRKELPQMPPFDFDGIDDSFWAYVRTVVMWVLFIGVFCLMVYVTR